MASGYWIAYPDMLDMDSILDSTTLENGNEQGKWLDLVDIQKLQVWKYSISRVWNTLSKSLVLIFTWYLNLFYNFPIKGSSRLVLDWHFQEWGHHCFLRLASPLGDNLNSQKSLLRAQAGWIMVVWGAWLVWANLKGLVGLGSIGGV